MQTITSDQAHSGDMSSMTGNGNDFSITLEYPLKIIPDSLKNQIDIDFWAYQSSLNHEAKLVVEASGIDFNYYWNGTELNSGLKEINEWENYEKSIVMPDSIKQADLIKIYIYNTSNTKIYIDDFKIKFH